VGAGVVDRLRQLNVGVIGVQFGAKADGFSPSDEIERYANKRAEMYGLLRQALKAGLASPDLADALALTYAYPAMAGAGAGRHWGGGSGGGKVESEWDPF